MRQEPEGEVVEIMFEVYKFNHHGLKKLMFYNKTSGHPAFEVEGREIFVVIFYLNFRIYKSTNFYSWSGAFPTVSFRRGVDSGEART